jgi:NCAIR mutase (PurE)-related protein
MDEYGIRGVLEKFKAKEISLQVVLDELRDFALKDLSFARLDTQREIRVGYPEIVYCAGKSAEQLRGIIEFIVAENADIPSPLLRSYVSHHNAAAESPGFTNQDVHRGGHRMYIGHSCGRRGGCHG